MNVSKNKLMSLEIKEASLVVELKNTRSEIQKLKNLQKKSLVTRAEVVKDA